MWAKSPQFESRSNRFNPLSLFCVVSKSSFVKFLFARRVLSKMDMETEYEVPKSLTILSGIFLALGALFMAVVIVDIVSRQGWKSMMLIMCV